MSRTHGSMQDVKDLANFICEGSILCPFSYVKALSFEYVLKGIYRSCMWDTTCTNTWSLTLLSPPLFHLPLSLSSLPHFSPLVRTCRGRRPTTVSRVLLFLLCTVTRCLIVVRSVEFLYNVLHDNIFSV